MKNTLILVLLILLSSYTLHAKKITGTILFENDTMEVTFKIPYKLIMQEPNYEKIQYTIKYFDQDGKKHVIRPSKAKEIRFENGYEEVRMLSRKNNLRLGSKYIFLKLEIEGKVKLFNYFYSSRSGGTYNGTTGMYTAGTSYSVERYILQKENEELKRPKSFSFRKDMMEYFYDCPDLVKLIEDREFRNYELELIVRYYNNHCGK